MSRRRNYREVKGSEIDRDRVYMQTAGFTPFPTWLPISRKFRFRRVAASSGATISEKDNIKQTRLETFWERPSLFQVMSPWEGSAFRLWPRAACPLPFPSHPKWSQIRHPLRGSGFKKKRGAAAAALSLRGHSWRGGNVGDIFFCLFGGLFGKRRIKEL